MENYLFQKLTDKKKGVCSKEDYATAKDEGSLLAYTEEYQMRNKIKGSCKYIHTVAEIVQNSSPDDWEKPVKIVYISPDGVNADGVVDITFRSIEESSSDALKDFKSSVLYTEIIKPLFL